MLFDDRLATVLRTAARSETGTRTQYRQLLDLLGTEGDAKLSRLHLARDADDHDSAEGRRKARLASPMSVGPR